MKTFDLAVGVKWSSSRNFYVKFKMESIFGRLKLIKTSFLFLFRQWKDFKGSLDWISSPSVKVQIIGGKLFQNVVRNRSLHLQWNFKLWSGNFAWGVKANIVGCCQNFWKRKVCWHHPSMFCLITSRKLSCQQFRG